MSLFKRHVCPADVEITVSIGDNELIGPVSGESLAYIVKYGGYPYNADLLNEDFTGTGHVSFRVRYLPPRRRG